MVHIDLQQNLQTKEVTCLEKGGGKKNEEIYQPNHQVLTLDVKRRYLVAKAIRRSTLTSLLLSSSQLHSRVLPSIFMK